jgi:hypothetical protein
MKGFKCFAVMLLVMMFTLNVAHAAPDIGNYAKIKLVPLPVSYPHTNIINHNSIVSHFKGSLPDYGTSYSINNYNDAMSLEMLIYSNPLPPITLFDICGYEYKPVINNNKVWVIPLQVSTKYYNHNETDKIHPRIRYRSKG